MKRILIALAIGYGLWDYYLKPSESPVLTNIAEDGSVLSAPVLQAPQPSFLPLGAAPAAVRSSAKAAESYHCDGRTHCSQMHSCEEAMYFLRNCPGTQMDGEADGIPCERQWCH
ncbi:excalibur calcium-binding domain-containing protein [Pseudomonas sp. N040]|uniref:excalibur calcium-binding domain-containing protein n=1 Tax=Pseudomonas sp. N040 TaxID=2785325 RepID=UPI0018A322A8|nr:excalibur calcium-binding domain-containing protein [Pseudomonas sp. N040]MBF7728533.1 excalibur calcium-binding domain-containing protein [Pseudomonas sp. N040]MBW7012173.1 excalibur calcium-binding domain-containing protein [Pseudomonas sp. N040]